MLPTEQSTVTVVAAVVGVFAGLATGLLANFIVIFQLLFFRTGAVLRALFLADPTFRLALKGELGHAPWHLEYLALGGVVIGLAWLLRPLAGRLGFRQPSILEDRRLRFAVVLLGFGLLLYYPLLALASLTRSLVPAAGASEGLMALLAESGRWRWVLVPTLGGLAVGLLVTYVAPVAGGHGVVEVIQSVREDQRVPGRVALWKPLLAGLTIATGGSCGREGPVVQMGAAVASMLGRRLGLSRQSRAILIASGAAAGIAASFNAPIAATTFALEIVLGDFGVRAFSPIVLAAVTATVTARSLIGPGGEIARVAYAMVSPWEIAAYGVLGICCGFGSVAYARTLHYAEEFFAGHRFGGKCLARLPRAARPMLGGAIVGVIALGSPQVLGNGYETMNAALFAQLSLGTLLLIFPLKLLASGSTLGSGAPGGSFFPAVFLGAMLGGAFGTVLHVIAPASTGGAGAYAAVGMGALVAGATLAPLTGILMIFELTGNYQVVPPLMVACGLAAVTMQWLVGGSIYSLKIARSAPPPGKLLGEPPTA